MTYELVKEKNEAIRAGERALASLNKALDELSGARTWGVIDMFGGSFLSSYIKRGRLNRAQEAIHAADPDLKAFSKELRDVKSVTEINVNTHDILGLADLFYENFLVDYLMQNRIKTAQREVQEAIRIVEDALKELRRL